MQIRQGTYNRDADILLAEPDPEQRQWTSSVLRRLGCRVTIAHGGAQTLSMTQARRFDAVLIDCLLPLVDGHPASREIRRQDTRAERHPTPIIGLVHPADADRFSQMNEAGMDAWLPKPVDYDRAEEVLGDLLQHRPSRQEPAADAAMVSPTELACITERLAVLRQMGGPELVDDLIHIFPEENGPLVEAMAVARERQDDSQLFRLAHRLKSSASNLGMQQLANLCRRVESVATHQGLEPPASIIADLRQAYDHSLRRLATALGELRPAGT